MGFRSRYRHRQSPYLRRSCTTVGRAACRCSQTATSRRSSRRSCQAWLRNRSAACCRSGHCLGRKPECHRRIVLWDQRPCKGAQRTDHRCNSRQFRSRRRFCRSRRRRNSCQRSLGRNQRRGKGNRGRSCNCPGNCRSCRHSRHRRTSCCRIWAYRLPGRLCHPGCRHAQWCKIRRPSHNRCCRRSWRPQWRSDNSRRNRQPRVPVLRPSRCQWRSDRLNPRSIRRRCLQNSGQLQLNHQSPLPACPRQRRHRRRSLRRRDKRMPNKESSKTPEDCESASFLNLARSKGDGRTTENSEAFAPTPIGDLPFWHRAGVSIAPQVSGGRAAAERQAEK